MLKKSILIPLIIFTAIAGSLYMLLSNAYIEIFSGKQLVHDYLTGANTWKDGNVSLLSVSRNEAELNKIGYLTAIFTIILIPGLLAWLVRKNLVKKEKANDSE